MTLWTPLNGTADFAASGATFKAGYRADQSSEITLESGSSYVAGWADYSGNGYNLSQVNFFGNFYQAIYSATGWDGSLPALTPNSNGSSCVGLQITSGFGVTGPVSAFAVAKTASGGSGCRLVSMAASGQQDYGGQGQMAIACDPGTPGSIYDWYNFVNPGQSETNGNGYVISSVTDATSLSIGLNGAALTTSGITYSSTTYDMLGVGVQCSGSQNSSGAWAAPIAEVILVTGTVTTTLRQIIEGYLAWKWGLNSQLPNTHPYYSAPPTTGGGTVVVYIFPPFRTYLRR